MATTLSSWRISARREWQFLCSSPWDMALVTWIPWLSMIIFAAMFYSAVPRSLPIAIVDDSRGPVSRELIRAVQAAPALDTRAHPLDLQHAWSMVRAMEVDAVLHIPVSTDESIQRGEAATIFAFYNAALTTAGSAAFRDLEAAISSLSPLFVLQHQGLQQGVGVLRPAPVSAQVTVLFNPARSFEQFLLGLILPAVLHFMLCVAMTSAYCRELRDSTVAQWVAQSGGNLLGAIIGKSLIYVPLFFLYGCAALIWVSYIRGDGIAGSLPLLLGGQLLMFFAYAAIGLMLAGVVRNMPTALSAVGLYSGTSLAFCGATFPIDGASLFARIWHLLLPFTSYVKLDAAERYVAAPLNVSLVHIGALLLFIVIPGTIGFFRYRGAVNDPSTWGQR
jgi:ABC-2 type transport system permease protein